jgi:hypothetical protein
MDGVAGPGPILCMHTAAPNQQWSIAVSRCTSQHILTSVRTSTATRRSHMLQHNRSLGGSACHMHKQLPQLEPSPQVMCLTRPPAQVMYAQTLGVQGLDPVHVLRSSVTGDATRMDDLRSCSACASCMSCTGCPLSQHGTAVKCLLVSCQAGAAAGAQHEGASA